MKRGGKEEASVFGLLFVTWIIGIVYLGLGNTFSDRYVGILQRGSVFTDSNCTTKCNNGGKNCHTKCTNTYYIDEIFLKNTGSTSTCTVRRWTPYYFKGDADNFVSRMILGTSRQLYQTVHSHGTCIDNKIRSHYNAIGGTLFGFTTFIMIIILLFVFGEQIRKWKSNFKCLLFTQLSCSSFCCRLSSSSNNETSKSTKSYANMHDIEAGRNIQPNAPYFSGLSNYSGYGSYTGNSHMQHLNIDSQKL